MPDSAFYKRMNRISSQCKECENIAKRKKKVANSYHLANPKMIRKNVTLNSADGLLCKPPLQNLEYLMQRSKSELTYHRHLKTYLFKCWNPFVSVEGKTLEEVISKSMERIGHKDEITIDIRSPFSE